MEGNRSGRAISFHMLKILNENYHEKETNKCLIAIQDKLAAPNGRLASPLLKTKHVSCNFQETSSRTSAGE